MNWNPDLKKTKRERAAQNIHHIDRLPPHSNEAEQAILGCVLLDCNLCLPQCVEAFRVGAEVFYDLRHQTIYSAMQELGEARKPIDLVTLHQCLKDKNLLEEVGGDIYISTLPDTVGSSFSVETYIAVVREKYLLRKTIHACTNAVSRIYESESNPDGLIDELERDILSVRGEVTTSRCVSAKELIKEAVSDIDEIHQRHGLITGMATGFTDFDKMTGGLQSGEMIVIAGYPGGGKTSLAMNIAEHAVLNLKLPVGVFSLEMTAKSLAMRMLCSRARVNMSSVRDGFLAERDFPKLAAAAVKIANSSLWVEDASDLSIFQLRAKARRMVQQYGIKLFIIDYIQLLNAIGGPRKVESREQEVADISRGIKGLAKETNVPVIALSQLNDDGALRNSRAIGQDADIVSMLEYPKNKDDDEEDNCAVPVNWKIKKQRNGPTGPVYLTFLKPYTRFESAARVSDDDVPQDRKPYKE